MTIGQRLDLLGAVAVANVVAVAGAVGVADAVGAQVLFAQSKPRRNKLPSTTSLDLCLSKDPSEAFHLRFHKSEPFTYNRYRRELRHLWSSRTPVYETPTVATAAMITSATSKVAMDRP